MIRYKTKQYVRQDYYRIEQLNKKVQCLMSQFGTNAPRVLEETILRYLTRLEWERLQTLPDGYTNGVSEISAKKAIGNGWTVDVIAHIFSFIPKPLQNADSNTASVLGVSYE